MEPFEANLRKCLGALERFVRFKIANRADADDVFQEILLAAYQGRFALREDVCFKSWLIGIARHKCSDYYRRRPPVQEVEWKESYASRSSAARFEAVHETMGQLSAAERQILSLFYLAQLPQAEIATRLGIPLGTVKSRLHSARASFRRLYPCPPRTSKGGTTPMKDLPQTLPEYTIETIDAAPFAVRHEAMPGWFIIPRLGEKMRWGIYELPSRDRSEYTDMHVVGRAEVHGEEGVEIVAIQHDASDYFRTGSVDRLERRFVAQLTDTHCRLLAESHMEKGVRKLYTFLDGDPFLNNWGYGPDNCGSPIHLAPQGRIIRHGNVIEAEETPEAPDIVGRYRVTIGGKRFDTVCLMDVMTFNDDVLSEEYLDQNGHTVLWRRFNADNWAFPRYQKLWSEMLPDNERLIVNGKTFVNWYDCITDAIL